MQLDTAKLRKSTKRMGALLHNPEVKEALGIKTTVTTEAVQVAEAKGSDGAAV